MKNEKVAILIKKIALKIEKLSIPVLAPYELTNTQYKIMVMLYTNQDKSVRQADIEENFSMTNPTVTGIIQNLEKKNLVKRVQNPYDKRSKLVVLTDKAISMRKEIDGLGEMLETQVTKNLTNEEYGQLISLLKKIYE